MEQPKKGPLGLIARWFGIPLAQMKEERRKLTDEDCQQLGSAVARAEGLKPEDLSFELVPY